MNEKRQKISSNKKVNTSGNIWKTSRLGRTYGSFWNREGCFRDGTDQSVSISTRRRTQLNEQKLQQLSGEWEGTPGKSPWEVVLQFVLSDPYRERSQQFQWIEQGTRRPGGWAGRPQLSSFCAILYGFLHKLNIGRELQGENAYILKFNLSHALKSNLTRSLIIQLKLDNISECGSFIPHYVQKNPWGSGRYF